MGAVSFGFRTYPWQYAEDTLMTRLQQFREAGISRVVCSTLYHDARHLLPDGPGRRMVWCGGGRSYVPVRQGRYPEGLAPEEAHFGVPLPHLMEAADKTGIGVEAWSVSLHRDDLLRRALDQPLSVEGLPFAENVWGEPQWANLCPSRTTARDYLVAHVADVASSGVTAIQLEGANYPRYEHGAHHESLFVPFTDVEKRLASLCFCNACKNAAAHLDVERLQREILAILEMRLQGEEPAEPDLGQLEEFLAVRQAAVSAMVAEISSTVPQISVRFSTQSTIAGPIFYTGNHGAEPAATLGKWYGIDYGALEEETDGFILLGYIRDHAALKAHLEGYIERGVKRERAVVVLRPMKVDCAGPDDLVKRLDLVIDLGFRAIDFTHFFARPSEIAMVAKAIKPLI